MGNDSELKLMRSAIECVAQFGIEGTTIKKIATAAGLSEGNVYRHFSSKEELLEKTFIAVDEKMCRFFMCDKEHLVVKDDQKQSVKNLWESYVKYMIENRNETLFFFYYYHSNLFTDETQSKRSLNNGSLIPNLLEMEQLFNISAINCTGIIYICALSISISTSIILRRGDIWVSDGDSVFEGIYAGVMSLHQKFVESMALKQ